MSRLIIICEGQTEREFCNQSLKQYVFPISGTYIQSPLIKRSMGGIVKWSNIKKQIESHLRNESNVYVTTLIYSKESGLGHFCYFLWSLSAFKKCVNAQALPYFFALILTIIKSHNLSQTNFH